MEKGNTCAAPYISTYLGTEGQYMPCCVFDTFTPMPIVDGKTQLLEVLNSEKVVKLRKDLYEGKKPAGCKACWKLEEKGHYSLRHFYNSNFESNDLVDKTIKNNFYLPELNLKHLDIRFSNKCNLKCTTCNSNWSTAWYSDEQAINFPVSEYKNKTIQNTDELLKQIYNQAHNIQEIYFAGGEPLMQEEHWLLINKLIELNYAKNIKLTYSTNFSKLHFGKYNVIPLWNKFKEVEILASLDGSHKRAEYIRKNLVWDKVIDNIEVLKSDSPNVKFKLAPTVSWMNVFNIFELHKEWVTEGYIDIDSIHINILSYPMEFSISNLPVKFKRRLKILYKEHIDWIKTFISIGNTRGRSAIVEISKINTFLDLKPNFNWVYTFVYKNKKLDNYRKTNFFNIYTEFKELEFMYDIKPLEHSIVTGTKGVWFFKNDEDFHGVTLHCGRQDLYTDLGKLNHKYVFGRSPELDTMLQKLNFSNLLIHTFSELETLYQDFAVNGLIDYMNELEVSKSIYSFTGSFIENNRPIKKELKHTVLYNLGGTELIINIGTGNSLTTQSLNSNEGLLVSNVINPYISIGDIDSNLNAKVLIMKGYVNLTTNNKRINDSISTKIDKLL